MKVTFSFQNNNSTKPQKQNVVFGAGLTSKMVQEIRQSNVMEISGKLAQRGISTDFRGNKVVAWCCNKTIEIFEQLNKRFKVGFALPKGIFVEDFEKLNIEDKSAIGFCNLARTNLIKDSEKETPSGVIYFDTLVQKRANASSEMQWLYDWGNIDSISDYRYAIRQAGTDSFLDIFLHEASHNVHLDKLLEKYSGKVVDKKILSAKNEKQIAEYQKKYERKISQICDYALADPFEAIACDMSKVISKSLDAETLIPTKNPFVSTPYENLSFWQRIDIPNYSDEKRPLKEILRRFWNGKFE